jgi:hypothetical protein
MSWENLEDLMTHLLMLDKAMTVPGSGNGKGEEDVIGLSTITQCKYSETKNVSILRKDIDRLLAAAELQNKIPIFVTENNGLKLVSIPDSIIFKDVLNIIVGMSLVRFVNSNLSKIKTTEERIEYKKLITRATKIINAVHAKYLDIIDGCDISLNKENEFSLEWINQNQTNLFEE